MSLEDVQLEAILGDPEQLPAIHDCYVKFQRAYRTWMLSTFVTHWQRRNFLNCFWILDVSSLQESLLHRDSRSALRDIEAWEGGFEIWLERKRAFVDSILPLAEEEDEF